ncbi:MAG: hypothetical protein WD623_12910 [Marinobacter sp.]|uniref:hypothetical protein n=1 Tax=Marinobacter sp. TaxID=50741 RepID=UPI0034A059EB
MRETLVQAMLSVAILCFSILVGFVGLGFLVAGLYLTLELWYTPAAAAALTGVALLALALLLLLICRAMMGARPAALPHSSEGPSDDLSGLMQDAAAMKDASRRLERMIKKNFPLAAGGAFATGFLLGVNPNARHSIGKTLSEMSSEGLDIFMKSQSRPDSGRNRSER